MDPRPCGPTQPVTRAMALASAARLALAQQALAQQSDDGGVAPPPARGGQMLAAVALSAKMKIDLKKMERKRLQRVCRACGVCTGGRWHAQVRRCAAAR